MEPGGESPAPPPHRASFGPEDGELGALASFRIQQTLRQEGVWLSGVRQAPNNCICPLL